MEKEKVLSGYLFALCSTAFWAGNLILARGLNMSIPPVSLAFLRWLTAVVVFLPFGLKPMIREWKQLKMHLPYLALTAFLGISLFNTLVYTAGRTTTALNLSLISLTFPIFIVIFARIFQKESITVNRGIGILLVAAGVVFLITRGDLSRLKEMELVIGDFWILLAAVTFAVYSLLLRKKPKAVSFPAFQFTTFFLGLIFIFPFFLWQTLAGPPLVFSRQIVLAVLYVGIFASFTAFLLWNQAIMRLGPARAGMVYYTLPVFSGILAFTFLDEKITLIHLGSMVLIIGGILTANLTWKRKKYRD